MYRNCRQNDRITTLNLLTAQWIRHAAEAKMDVQDTAPFSRSAYRNQPNHREKKRSMGRRKYNPPPAQLELLRFEEHMEKLRPTERNEQASFDFLDEDRVYYYGDLDLIHSPCVSIIGTRNASEEGVRRSGRLARLLVENGIVVVSGLAKGIDTAAHQSTLQNGGRTIAVIGTPLEKAYPAENKVLQETIWRDHLLMSPFPMGKRTYPSDFPKRNRVMALLSDASVVIEASETSGTIHQAKECERLGRWLFFTKSMVETGLDWVNWIGLDWVAPRKQT